MTWLNSLCNKKELIAIGLMSGTSSDGLDISAVRITRSKEKPRFSMMGFVCKPYPEEVRSMIRQINDEYGFTSEKLSTLNFYLGHLFSEYVLEFSKQEKIHPGEIDFIASHGHTIQHLPIAQQLGGLEVSSTLQVGDPAVIANRTGILTIGDFRIGDMALNGQGAPLMPFFDLLYLRDRKKNRLILNIGGIANLTAICAGCSKEEVRAFDTGPGNIIIDSLAKDLFSIPYDSDGALARKGTCIPGLLNRLLEHNFFSQKPPKSADIKMFQESLETILAWRENEDVSKLDMMATATELTCRTIHDTTLNQLTESVEWHELIASGGGTQNSYLMETLKQYFEPTIVLPSEEVGIPSDAKEAIGFAMLGYYTIHGLPNNLPAVTGAKKSTVLGKICLPPVPAWP